ncbi:MAG: hypothetical protein DRJ52_06795 [Thermoprotei archaeon]|nr:MAG: hypothetical protein DRJ52_06795 [Thermoprotei archaeon]RLE99687.1 MAG: hypothetical protein DRJ63_04605 [Thermoprotei archaeon]
MKWLKIFIKQLLRNRKFLAMVLLLAIISIKLALARPNIMPLGDDDPPDPPPESEPDPDVNPL